MQVADVRMVQRGHGAGFALEPRAPVRIGRKLFRQDFDRNNPVETCIPRFVDLTHAAGANEPEDLVGAKADAGRQRHGSRARPELYGCRRSNMECARRTGPSVLLRHWVESPTFGMPKGSMLCCRSYGHAKGKVGSPAGHPRPDDPQNPRCVGPAARVWNRTTH